MLPDQDSLGNSITSERKYMPLKRKLRFKIGEWIVHHIHGVGQVHDIEEKGLDGEKNTFYKVTTKEIDYWIPIEDEDKEHLEPLRSKEDFFCALEILSQPPEPISDHPQSRKKQIQEKWLEGNLMSRAELIRDLNGRMTFDHLNFNEKELLEKATADYINEWVIADDTLTHIQAEMHINNALEEGLIRAQKQNINNN
jgi:RNA polymerase-interacting CarD/CdnL/TRCF family regulator